MQEEGDEEEQGMACLLACRTSAQLSQTLTGKTTNISTFDGKEEGKIGKETSEAVVEWNVANISPLPNKKVLNYFSLFFKIKNVNINT